METEDRETWANLNAGDVYIRIDDPYTPNAKVDHLISPNAQISITPEERRFNQSRIPDRAQDLFTNGTLTPVQLVDTAKDFEQIVTAPNVKSETDLQEMFSLSLSNFKKAVADLDNLRVLERLAEVGKDESVKASLAQANAIQARIEEVRPDINEERHLGNQTEDVKLKEIKLSNIT